MEKLFFIVLLLSVGCSKEKSHSTRIATTNNNIDTLSNKSLKPDEYSNQGKISNQNKLANDRVNITRNKNEKLDIIEVTTNSDTLNIVPTSDYLFYPFEKLYKINDFTKLNTCFSNDEKQRYLDNKLEIYQVTCKQSHIVLFPDKRAGSNRDIIEIVSGDILDKEVVLVNGIRVGLKNGRFSTV